MKYYEPTYQCLACGALFRTKDRITTTELTSALARQYADGNSKFATHHCSGSDFIGVARFVGFSNPKAFHAKDGYETQN